MRARPPLRQKPDTSTGFRARYRPTARHTDLAQSIARLDGALDGFAVHPEWANDLRRRSALSNAHSSTSIEGNPLTREEAEEAVRRFDTDELQEHDPDRREIIQHVRYFRRLAGDGEAPRPDLSIDEILAVHAELLDQVIPSDHRPGTFRGPLYRTPVTFGANEGTPWERVEEEVEALLDWYYGEGLRLPLPIRVAIWLHEFLTIHPFGDGNGRAGRALTHRLLATEGLPNTTLVVLDARFNDDRAAYTAALDEAREADDLTPWVDYFLRRLQDAYEEAHAMVAALTRTPDEVTGAERAVLEWIIKSGAREFRAGEIAPSTGYKPITVSQALKSLADRGHVRHNGKRGKASRYRPVVPRVP